MIIVRVFFKRGTAPPEPTLAFSPVLGLVWGVCFVLFATIQLRLSPPRTGVCFCIALKVLHLSLFSDGLGQ